MRFAHVPNRFVNTLLWGCIGAAAGYVVTNGAFMLACYAVDHTSSERLWTDWSAIFFTIASGMAGAVHGSVTAESR